MYNRIEHSGNITEDTTLVFELPRYAGCLTLQILTFNFSGNTKIFLTDPAGIKTEYNGVEIQSLNTILSKNSIMNPKSQDSYILSIPQKAAKLDLVMTGLSSTSYIDKVIINT